jgi:glucose/arabinose dehydrogenase
MKKNILAACVGVIFLLAGSVSAQNLFVVDNTYAGAVDEFTSGVAQNTFATGLDLPYAEAFNNAGDLFVSDANNGEITEITPGGAESTFATGLSHPWGLAFNGAGDMFVANQLVNNVLEITSDGQATIYASGFADPLGVAVQPVPEPTILGLLGLGAAALVIHRRRLRD